MRLRFPLLGLCLLLAACAASPVQNPIAPAPQNSSAGSISSEVAKQETWIAPIERASERVTKKPFGIFITPKDSPVQPEKFSGYHTGTDFELLPGESPHAVTVRAACSGKVIYRQWVKRYGGVVVQRCTLSGEPVTALYGHLSLASIDAALNQTLQSGDPLGTLGTGFSEETDGERPHLHFSIHRGERVELKGYVPTQKELGGWVDPATVLGLPL